MDTKQRDDDRDSIRSELERMMRQTDEEIIAEARESLRRRRRRPREPLRAAELVSRLLSRKGYAQQKSASAWLEAWALAAGGVLARDSRPGRLRAGVLEIAVRNSATMQELSFIKQGLLRSLRDSRPEAILKDLRFRVASFD